MAEHLLHVNTPESRHPMDKQECPCGLVQMLQPDYATCIISTHVQLCNMKHLFLSFMLNFSTSLTAAKLTRFLQSTLSLLERNSHWQERIMYSRFVMYDLITLFVVKVVCEEMVMLIVRHLWRCLLADGRLFNVNFSCKEMLGDNQFVVDTFSTSLFRQFNS